jgi:dolichol kinase
MNEVASVEAAGEIGFKQELIRKATHLGALVIPGGYYILGLERMTAALIMLVIGLTMLLIDISRMRDWWLWRNVARHVIGSVIRKHEKDGDFTGATYILLSSALTIFLFQKPIAIAALSFIIVGDSFAAVIGRKYGRIKFANKSLEGSLGCLLGTVIVALLAPGIPLSVGLLGAVVATLVEAWPMGVDDNVAVPLMSGLAMHMVMIVKIFG